jgi:hypothetical protein
MLMHIHISHDYINEISLWSSTGFVVLIHHTYIMFGIVHCLVRITHTQNTLESGVISITRHKVWKDT